MAGRVHAGRDHVGVGGLDRLLGHDLDAELRRAGLGVLVRGQVDVVVVEVLVVHVLRDGRGDAVGPSRAHRGELRLLELAPGPAWPRCEHRFDELLVEGVCHVRGSSVDSDAGSVLGRGQPAATGARARSRVWSRRRSSDRRCSLRRRRSSDRRSIVSPIGIALGLGDRVAVEGAALLPFGVVELERQPLDLIRERVVAEFTGVRPGTGDQGLPERPALLVEAVEDPRQRVRRPHAVVVAGSGDDDGAVQLAGDLRRQAVGAEAVEDRVVRLRHQQHQAKQLLLGPRDGAQDVVDRQRVGGAGDGLGGEPVAPVAAVGLPHRTPVHRLEQRPLLHPRHLLDLAEVGVAHHGIGQAAQDVEHGVDEARLAAGRPQVVGAGVDVDQVVDDRLRRPDLLAPAIGLVAQDLVGVAAVGQLDDAHVVQGDPGVVARQLADQLLERRGAERAGLLARGVDVVGEGDPLRVAGDQRDLLGRQRGAERGDHVVEPGLVGHQRVGVALDDDGLAALADRRLRPVDQVQRPALVEQRRRRGVEVLRPVVPAVLADALLAQDAPAEADGMPVRVADREDHPLAEAVVDAAAALARAGQADLEELARGHVALRGELADELVPARGRPAQLLLLDRGVGEPAAAQVGERRLARLRVHQDRVVEGDRPLHDLAQPGVVGVLTLRPLVDLDAGAPGQDLQRLREADAVALHHEREDVAVLATAEAVPGVAARRDDEARRLLAVERAQALEGRAGLAELNGFAHHVRDGEPALDLGHGTDGQRCSCPTGSAVRHAADIRAGLSSLDRPPICDCTPGRGA